MAETQESDESRKLYSIKDLAGRFGVSAGSLRNWERDGHIPPASRTAGRHRRYTCTHVQAIAHILEPDAKPGEGNA